MLISHYQSLHGIQASVEGLVGTIDPECDILAVAEQARLLTVQEHSSLTYYISSSLTFLIVGCIWIRIQSGPESLFGTRKLRRPQKSKQKNSF